MEWKVSSEVNVSIRYPLLSISGRGRKEPLTQVDLLWPTKVLEAYRLDCSSVWEAIRSQWVDFVQFVESPAELNSGVSGRFGVFVPASVAAGMQGQASLPTYLENQVQQWL